MSNEYHYILELCGRAFDWRYYDMLKIPGPPSHWFAGNMFELGRPDYHVLALEWANKYGGICRFRLGYQNIILVSDPVVAAEVLGRGPRAVPRKCIGYRFFELAINHVNKVSFFTTMDEEQWKTLRKGTAAAFSFSKIRSYFPTAYKHAQYMASHLGSLKEPVEVQHHLEVMLLDVFVEALFEIDPHMVDSNAVAHAMNLLLEEASSRVRLPARGLFLGLLHPKLSAQISTARSTVGALYELIHDEIRKRGQPKHNDASLWACLARLQDHKTGKLLSKEQLMAEIGVFIVAGYDTSSHTIAWILYALAVHREEQERIHRELASRDLLQVPGGPPARQLQMDDLPELTHLNNVVNETMRMYPVGATGSVRECSKPTQIGPYTVPSGTMVWPMIYALNMSNSNWKDAQTFRPDRWLEKGTAYMPGSNNAKRFLPFSDGTKNCLGQALGLMEVRTVLVSLLSRYRVDLAPDMGGQQGVESNMMCALTLKINGGLRLLFTPHEHGTCRVAEPAPV